MKNRTLAAMLVVCMVLALVLTGCSNTAATTTTAAETTTAASEAEVEQIWAELQQYLTDVGLDAVEAKMTERYLEGLKVYQDAGFFTDIVTE